ncbi:MAG: hypothetical protein E6G87_04380, partial [Alphaproteobacteria bacterium]
MAKDVCHGAKALISVGLLALGLLEVPMELVRTIPYLSWPVARIGTLSIVNRARFWQHAADESTKCECVMTIESVDFFYLSMPVVTDAGDGSQDALVVRVVADGIEGWGECEASPLVSIAAYVAPMSHGACKPVRDVVLGQKIDDASDITRMSAAVELECMDLLQAAHT